MNWKTPGYTTPRSYWVSIPPKATSPTFTPPEDFNVSSTSVITWVRTLKRDVGVGREGEGEERVGEEVIEDFIGERRGKAEALVINVIIRKVIEIFGYRDIFLMYGRGKWGTLKSQEGRERKIFAIMGRKSRFGSKDQIMGAFAQIIIGPDALNLVGARSGSVRIAREILSERGEIE